VTPDVGSDRVDEVRQRMRTILGSRDRLVALTRRKRSVSGWHARCLTAGGAVRSSPG
jgi:hypothetical protein